MPENEEIQQTEEQAAATEMTQALTDVEPDTTLFGADGPIAKHTEWGSTWKDRDELRQAYFAKPNEPGYERHDEAVKEIERLFLMQTKRDDAEAVEAEGLEPDPAAIKLPPPRSGQEWDEGAAAEAMAVAEQVGVPAALVQEAVNVIAKTGAPPMSAEEGEKRLRVIFGDKYDEKLAQANAVLEEFPAVKDWIIGSGYANDPGLIFWLAKQGAARADVHQQIKTLSTSDAYLQRAHPDHEKTVLAVQALYRKLFRGGNQ